MQRKKVEGVTTRQFKIEWKPSSNFTAGRKGNKIIAIVDHITAGLMPGCLSWMCNPGAKASAHYLVTRQGKIYQLVKDAYTAWHAGAVNRPNWALYSGGNPNHVTIGIEHEGYREQSGDGNLTEAQYQASLWLHKQLINKYNLPIDDNHILGHYRIDSVNRPNCPGPKFPWQRLFNDLRNGVIDTALDKWMIDGGREGLKYLEEKGLVFNADDWGTEPKLAEPVPAYLLWIMLQRLTERMEGK